MWKIKDKYRNWSEDQIDILQVITSKFSQRFNKDVATSVKQEVPFSKDV